ncbi:hypothetical protein GUJ93_ZPchr0006g46405 [Zizania palustris]|uniref:Uncharacterized protein n=1 Tax=Zizania palustris TaxID=103762 RepID=A0A8J5SQ57_ZIZPA|nr:hypothetical protein GUJ93_ZPchr0006g46405 [Zizania palustris]
MVRISPGDQQRRRCTVHMPRPAQASRRASARRPSRQRLAAQRRRGLQMEGPRETRACMRGLTVFSGSVGAVARRSQDTIELKCVKEVRRAMAMPNGIRKEDHRASHYLKVPKKTNQTQKLPKQHKANLKFERLTRFQKYLSWQNAEFPQTSERVGEA